MTRPSITGLFTLSATARRLAGRGANHLPLGDSVPDPTPADLDEKAGGRTGKPVSHFELTSPSSEFFLHCLFDVKGKKLADI